LGSSRLLSVRTVTGAAVWWFEGSVDVNGITLFSKHQTAAPAIVLTDSRRLLLLTKPLYAGTHLRNAAHLLQTEPVA
jgi:hypothetical protein